MCSPRSTSNSPIPTTLLLLSTTLTLLFAPCYSHFPSRPSPTQSYSLTPMLMLLFSCLSDLSFFISYPPLLILLRPYSCSSTTLLLLSYSWLLFRTLLLLLFYSFAVILILPTPSLLLLDYSPCVYSCFPIAIIAFAFSCSYSLPPTLLFLSFKE